MSAFNGVVLTEKGLALQAKVQSGIKLTFTNIKLGDGAYSGDLSTLTNLEHIVKILPIESIVIDNGKTRIRTSFQNAGVITGFYIKEIGLFASDPDEGEILYAVANTGGGPADYIPAENFDVVEEQIELITLVGNATNVTAIIDKSIIYAKYEDFEMMKNNFESEVLNYKNIVKTALHSGFLEMGDLDFTHMEANKIKIKASKVNVNGFFIDLPEQFIDCGVGPTADFVAANGRKGIREDLIFLEVWKELGVDSNDIEIKHRIRVVEDVDFETFKDNGFHKGSISSADSAYNSLVTPQGGNELPVLSDITSTIFKGRTHYTPTSTRAVLTNISYPLIEDDDCGLYIAGAGDQGSKDSLLTYDGYAYAVPMFRLERRNNEGYDQNNPNGGIEYNELSFTNIFDVPLNITTDFTMTPDDYLKVVIGRYQYYTGGINYAFMDVIEKKGDNTISAIPQRGSGSAVYTNGTWRFYLESNRPDKKHTNIVYSSDIKELWHKVALDGVDMEMLLKQSMNQALMGKLTPVKMRKQYHGIRKTPIDANTVFYASMEDVDAIEVGSLALTGAYSYSKAPTGIGVAMHNGSKFSSDVSLNLTTKATLDIFVETSYIFKTNTKRQYIANLWKDGLPLFGISNERASNTIAITLWTTESSKIVSFTLNNKMLLHEVIHLRLTKNGDIIKLYVNGELVKTTTSSYNLSNGLFGIASSSHGYGFLGMISDVHISNIDRGAVFATLPQDFINSEAEIKAAFTKQRQSFGDPLTGQATSVIAESNGIDSRGLIKIQATEGVWVNGDTIKIAGEAGEVISGLIDEDTALTVGLSFSDGITDPNITANRNAIIVDDVSNFSVGDTFTNGGVNTYTITAIDVSTNVITVSSPIWSPIAGEYRIYENTPSSSVPLVNFLDDDTTKISVTGTWSGLGTNEAIFTLGTNGNLTNEDIFINYSLNSQEHEGQIPVYDEVLEGEMNGKKLVKSDKIAITDDFKGKIVGSVFESPHIAISNGSTYLLNPSDTSYELSIPSKLSDLDADLYTISRVNNGEIAQMVFKFNILRMVEDKYGDIISTDKIEWLRNNLYAIHCNVHGMGSSPLGNHLYLSMYRNATSIGWKPPQSHDENYVKLLSLSTGWNPIGVIDSIDDSGYAYYITYADASDGITPSMINIDYVDVLIQFKSDTNFDILAPENTRRDAGKSNVLLVRKETREIRTLFPVNENDKITITGNVKQPYKKIDSDEYVTLLSQQPHYLITDLNSANGDKYGNHSWNNLAFMFGMDDTNLFGQIGYAEVPLAAESIDLNTGYEIKVCDYGFKSNYVTQKSLEIIDKPFIGLIGQLVLYKQEIKLLIVAQYNNTEKFILGKHTSGKAFLLDIKGRPLIKLAAGERRAETIIDPKSWKTPMSSILV